MNFEEFKKKADVFFENISSDEIVSEFEQMGYEFENIIDSHNYVPKKKYSFNTSKFTMIDGKNTVYSINNSFDNSFDNAA